jgi:hypothetical protein
MERLKQATALTPAEARRVEKIKAGLGYVPGVWLGSRVVRWMKSLPAVDIDRERTVDGPKNRMAQSP